MGSIPQTGIELASRLRHLADDLGQGRTGRIVGSRGWIPHLSAGVRSGSKALSYIGLAQGSTPPPFTQGQPFSVGLFSCPFPACLLGLRSLHRLSDTDAPILAANPSGVSLFSIPLTSSYHLGTCAGLSVRRPAQAWRTPRSRLWTHPECCWPVPIAGRHRAKSARSRPAADAGCACSIAVRGRSQARRLDQRDAPTRRRASFSRRISCRSFSGVGSKPKRR